MANISITTGNLRNVASSLKSLSEQMHHVAENMNYKVQNMRDWNDDRARQFIETTMTIKKNLDLHVGNFEKMSQFLRKYAEQQEDAEREQNRRMTNLGN